MSRKNAPARAEPCGFVLAGARAGVRFCDAPAERGSSYCARHRALCQVAPERARRPSAIVAEFARAAERATPPGLVPPDRAVLADPEPVEADGAR